MNKPHWNEAPALAADLYARHAYATRYHCQDWLLIGTETASGTVWRLAADDTPEGGGHYIGRGGTPAWAIAEATTVLTNHVSVRRLVRDIAEAHRLPTDRALLYVRQHTAKLRGSASYRHEIDVLTNAAATRLLNNAQ